MPRAGSSGAASVGHRTLPHTADLIVEAWAPTLEGCLAQAVAGLTDSYADTTNADATGRHEFRISATTPEQALVALLEEALYVLDALGAVVLGAHLEIHDAQLSGYFDFASVDAGALVGSVPKGIALSGLRLRRRDAGWRATVTVDV